jgi:hypothetical protein
MSIDPNIQALTTLALSVLERVNLNPEEELTVSQLATRKGNSEAIWRQRIESNPVWSEAFYPVGASGELRTTLRRVWRAEQILAESQVQRRFKTVSPKAPEKKRV